MARKTWIFVKRAILAPKHVAAIGDAWVLLLYIIDRADWETGVVHDWKADTAADDLGVHVQTIRRWLKRLKAGRYITLRRGQHDSSLVIHKWVNPRTYDSPVLNLLAENGSTEIESDQERSISEQAESDHGTLIEAGENAARLSPDYSQIDHATLRPSIKDHRSRSIDHDPAPSGAEADHDHTQLDPKRNYFWEGAFQLVYGQPYSKDFKISKSDSSKLGKLVKVIQEVDLPAESIPLIWRWWQRFDWRALQAKRLRQPVPRPTITQAIEVISVAVVWIKGGMVEELVQEEQHGQPAAAVTEQQASIADRINAHAHGTSVEYEQHRRRTASLPALR